MIDRCSSVQWENKDSSEIFNVRQLALLIFQSINKNICLTLSQILTDCYSILLQFYSKVAAFFRQQSRIKRVLETFKSEIPGIVANFNSKADDLARYVQVEILVTVAAIQDQQLESFGTQICHLPMSNRSHLSQF